jgi:hypothetical protein
MEMVGGLSVAPGRYGCPSVPWLTGGDVSPSLVSVSRRSGSEDRPCTSRVDDGGWTVGQPRINHCQSCACASRLTAWWSDAMRGRGSRSS